MRDYERIERAAQLSRELAREIKALVDATEDYDLGRLLKKIEAEVMDIQHNLKLASRTALGQPEDEE
jgi:hypothetical protein